MGRVEKARDRKFTQEFSFEFDSEGARMRIMVSAITIFSLSIAIATATPNLIHGKLEQSCSQRSNMSEREGVCRSLYLAVLMEPLMESAPIISLPEEHAYADKTVSAKQKQKWHVRRRVISAYKSRKRQHVVTRPPAETLCSRNEGGCVVITIDNWKYVDDKTPNHSKFDILYMNRVLNGLKIQYFSENNLKYEDIPGFYKKIESLKVAKSELIVFYFSGYALLDGDKYFIEPVDAKFEVQNRGDRELMEAQPLISSISKISKVTVFVLDIYQRKDAWPEFDDHQTFSSIENNGRVHVGSGAILVEAADEAGRKIPGIEEKLYNRLNDSDAKRETLIEYLKDDILKARASCSVRKTLTAVGADEEIATCSPLHIVVKIIHPKPLEN
jgi:hypothetical protein